MDLEKVFASDYQWLRALDRDDLECFLCEVIQLSVQGSSKQELTELVDAWRETALTVSDPVFRSIMFPEGYDSPASEETRDGWSEELFLKAIKKLRDNQWKED